MIVSWTSLDLDQAIRERHSTRMFLPQPVPRALVEEALALAQYAPSNSNIQPWHLVFASGPPRDRLVAALLDEAQRRPPNIPPLPESFPALSSRAGRSSLRGDGNRH
jgi:nitroreductase